MAETIYTCLIVDDEAAAHYVLENYIARVERLKLLGKCYNVLEAINFLHQQPVDLLFLDINMPEMTGFDLLKTLTTPPRVIITTAYSEYALESYEYWSVDYLMKPIEFPRFLKAIDRFFLTLPNDKNLEPVSGVKPDEPFTVKVDGELVRILPEELIHAQSVGNYVKLTTHKQTYLASITTTELEHRLPVSRFMRIHKSHIVALDKITRYGNGFVEIDGLELPVGITYRRELAERLK